MHILPLGYARTKRGGGGDGDESLTSGTAFESLSGDVAEAIPCAGAAPSAALADGVPPGVEPGSAVMYVSSLFPLLSARRIEARSTLLSVDSTPSTYLVPGRGLSIACPSPASVLWHPPITRCAQVYLLYLQVRTTQKETEKSCCTETISTLGCNLERLRTALHNQNSNDPSVTPSFVTSPPMVEYLFPSSSQQRRTTTCKRSVVNRSSTSTACTVHVRAKYTVEAPSATWVRLCRFPTLAKIECAVR